MTTNEVVRIHIISMKAQANAISMTNTMYKKVHFDSILEKGAPAIIEIKSLS